VKSEELGDPANVLLNWQEIGNEIHKLHRETTSWDRRSALLAIHKALMDAVERHLVDGGVAPDVLAKFREGRSIDYDLFIAEEAMVGADFCIETLDAVTHREVAAGRMPPDHQLRELALAGMAAPHCAHKPEIP